MRCENYLLAGRAIRIAWQVWRALPERRSSPHLGPAIRAAAVLNADSALKSRAGARKIADPGRIVWLADLLTRLPVRWGRCVQQTLITFRLLNDYGIPASICYGIPRDNPVGEGHAWVRLWQPEDRALLPPEPLDRFRIVFILPTPPDLPAVPAPLDQDTGASGDLIFTPAGKDTP